jgi:hypothetical protein
VHDPTQRDAAQRRQRARGGASAAGGRAPDALPPQDTAHLMTQGRAPDGHEQDPPEQETLTSVPTHKMAEQPCQNPAHAHRSPVPELWVCFDCFRCWEVPLAVSSPAGALADPAAPPAAPARVPAAARRQRRPATAGLPPAPGENSGAGAAHRGCQRRVSCVPSVRAGARAAARGRWSG